MNSKILISLFVVAFMASCSENEMQFPNGSKPKPSEKTERNVEKTAVAFASSLSESEIATKAGKKVSLSAVSVNSYNLPRGKETRSVSQGDPTKVYSVSLSDNKGSVILVSDNDSNVMPVAYFGGVANINVQEALEDTVSTLGFLVQQAVNESFGEVSVQASEEPYKVADRVKPKCKVAWRRFVSPYCKTKDGKNADVGRVAVAGAQALTVLRPYIDDGNFSPQPWGDLYEDLYYNQNDTRLPEREAQKVLREKIISYVANKVKTDFKETESKAKKENLISFFKEKFGIIDYDAKRVLEVLNTKHGIIVVSGYRAKHGWGPWESYVDWHIFIADGYVKYEDKDDKYYMHVNFCEGPRSAFDVYILSYKKHWDKDLAKKVGYKALYEHKLKYASFTYPSEKYW